MTRNPDMHGTRGTGGAGVEGEASCLAAASPLRWGAHTGRPSTQFLSLFFITFPFLFLFKYLVGWDTDTAGRAHRADRVLTVF